MEHPEMFYPSAKYEAAYITACIWSDGRIINNMVMKAMKQALDGLDLTRDPAGFTAFEIWSGRIQLCGERNTFS